MLVDQRSGGGSQPFPRFDLILYAPPRRESVSALAAPPRQGRQGERRAATRNESTPADRLLSGVLARTTVACPTGSPACMDSLARGRLVARCGQPRRVPSSRT